MTDKKAAKAARAIKALSDKADRRRAFGQSLDDFKSVRRGGHIRTLDGTVHN